MGKVLEPWLHQGRLDELPFYRGMASPNIPYESPCTNAIPPNCDLPDFALSQLPNFKLGPSRGFHAMFYQLPCFRQGLVPDLTLHEKILPNLDLPGKVNSSVDNPGIAKGLSQKQFLVFDQTGEKTTMVYRSGTDNSNQKCNTLGPEPTDYPDMSRVECHLSGTNMTNGLDENYDTYEGSDMREDTEEINALLYSDDEDNCSEDGEETSTGHSPSTMTGFEKQDRFDEDDLDEVASSSEPAKRQKLSSLTNASSFFKPNRSWDYEDDAESSCDGDKLVQCSNNRASLSGCKRRREEKIQKAVRVLQSVVPGAKGKDAVKVLDEAINYLTLLKTSALSLGFSSQ